MEHLIVINLHLYLNCSGFNPDTLETSMLLFFLWFIMIETCTEVPGPGREHSSGKLGLLTTPQVDHAKCIYSVVAVTMLYYYCHNVRLDFWPHASMCDGRNNLAMQITEEHEHAKAIALGQWILICFYQMC